MIDEKPLRFFRKDLLNLKEYLEGMRNHSTMRRYRRHLEELYNFNPKFYSILELQPDDFKKFFKFVDRKEISLQTKISYKTSIKKFIEDITFDTLARGIRILDYGVIMKNIKFGISASKKFSTMTIKPKHLQPIFDSQKGHYKIYTKILFYSGCRVGGLLNLKKKDINWRQRYFETQEKVTSLKSGWNLYYFPQFFVDEFKLFCNKTKRDKVCNISDTAIRKSLHKFDKRLRPHLIRHAFSNNFRKNGLEDTNIISILMNQKPSNVNALRYQEITEDVYERREVYDKYFPYYEKKDDKIEEGDSIKE